MDKTNFTNNKFFGSLSAGLNTYGSTIAMIGSMFSFGFALYSAFKASKKVVKVNDEFTQKVQEIKAQGLEEGVEKEKIKEEKTRRNINYALSYTKVGIFAGAGLGLGIAAKVMDFKTIGSLTALAMSQKDKLEKLAENGKKMLGEEKFQKLENATLEDMILENFMSDDGPVYMLPHKFDGKLFVDTNKGILFQCEEIQLRNALENAEKDCIRRGSLSEVELYEKYYGFESAPKNACMWWGKNNPFKAHLGKRHFDRLDADLPTIEYENAPTGGVAAGIPGFNK